jgi:hypothetical protein
VVGCLPKELPVANGRQRVERVNSPAVRIARFPVGHDRTIA